VATSGEISAAAAKIVLRNVVLTVTIPPQGLVVIKIGSDRATH
jgi:hypothetical protein